MVAGVNNGGGSQITLLDRGNTGSQNSPDLHSDTKRLESHNRAAGVFLDAAQEAVHTFAPLRAVLGAISAIYGNYEVSLRPSVRIIF